MFLIWLLKRILALPGGVAARIGGLDGRSRVLRDPQNSLLGGHPLRRHANSIRVVFIGEHENLIFFLLHSQQII
jgi:hypothetical protein